MKSKITSFIMTLMTMLMIAILVFLGIIIYNEYFGENIVGKVEDFVSNIAVANNNEIEKIETPNIIEVMVDSIEPKEVPINYSDNTYIDKYYYNQLNSDSKKIYNALNSNKENMRNGTYEINLGEEFSDILANENGEKLLGDYYQTAIEAFSYDNPDVFYIDYSKLYLNIETTVKGFKKKYRTFINPGNQQNYLTSEFQSQEQIENAINDIENVREYFIQNKKNNDYDNVKIIHDYLIDSIEYDQTLTQTNIYNLYGAIVNKRCVCEGYAKAFKYLMDAVNIPCTIVIGEATNSEGNSESHAWNYVQLDGTWYAIDCTWDDPILIGTGFVPISTKYKYFLKGEQEFNQSHFPNGEFTEGGKVFDFPQLSLYNY